MTVRSRPCDGSGVDCSKMCTVPEARTMEGDAALGDETWTPERFFTGIHHDYAFAQRTANDWRRWCGIDEISSSGSYLLWYLAWAKHENGATVCEPYIIRSHL